VHKKIENFVKFIKMLDKKIYLSYYIINSLYFGDFMDYCRCTDEELVRLIIDGNDECLHILINKYTGIIKSKALLLCPLADADDMLQEGIIALYSAVVVFDNSLSSFATFANLCIERSLISAYRKLFNKKQVPENVLVSLEDNEKPVTVTPESLIIEKEECLAFTEKIKGVLSDFELKVLYQYLCNNSYEAIAEHLGVDKKAVNNAMVRLRKKIRAIR